MPLHIEHVDSLDYASPLTVAITQNVTTEIAALNNDRKYLQIVNNSNTAMYLAVGADAVSGSGIYWAASGGKWEMTIDNLSSEAVDGICSASGKSVYVQEAN